MSESVRPWRVPDWCPSVDENKLLTLQRYYHSLMECNKRLNLIPVKTIPFVDLLHFTDSILGSRLIMEKASFDHIHDFGSGNGFPGMVFGVLYPDIRVTLVEKDARKCDFLEQAILELGLSNISVNRAMLELLPERSVEAAMARGLATIPKTLLATRKLFPKGGRLFHFKGGEWATEVSQIPSQLCSYWKPSLVGSYVLPVGEATFSIVRTEKFKD